MSSTRRLRSRAGGASRTRAAALSVCLALLAGGATPGAPARAETGTVAPAATLGADTVWEGTVEVPSLTTVEKGATLLIMPGTTVRFAAAGAGGSGERGGGLLIHGTLVAQGTPAAPIVFTSAAPNPTEGSWRGIAFDKAVERQSRLGDCVIEYAVNGLSGSGSTVAAERLRIRRNFVGVGAGREFVLELKDSEITENAAGIGCNQGSGLTVEGSRISKNRDLGISCVYGSSPRIVGNEIVDNGRIGVSCVQGSSPLIEGNLLSGHERGVFLELQSRPRILRNDIVGNKTGVWAEKLVFPLVADNLIAKNDVGVYCNYSGYPRIHGNNLVDNARFAVSLGDNQSIVVQQLIPYRDRGQHYEQPPAAEFPSPQSRKFAPFDASDQGLVDARGNWWGEAAAREMAAAGGEGNVAAIEDVRDKPDTYYNDVAYPRDRVAYAPWETAPNAAAGRPARGPSGVTGKIVFEGGAAAGARVHAYRDAAGGFAGEGVAYSGPAGPDGAFSLSLPPGAWFLVAKGATPAYPQRDPGEGGFFGYYGGNPVTLGAGERREANIQVVRRKGLRVESAGVPDRTLLAGLVLGPKGPVEGAAVFVYPDASRGFRGPDLFGPQGAAPGGTDGSGGFEADVPPGRYFVVAVRHAGGERLGPLKAGDLHGWYDGNPVTLAAGTRTTITVQPVEKLKDQERKPGAPAASRTGISGVIRDPSGAVPAGVYAYATTDSNLMTGMMPPHRSTPVGPDGAFFIDLPGGATYYVGARSGFGGPPLPGQWHGFHGTGKPEGVAVGADSVSGGLEITVRRME